MSNILLVSFITVASIKWKHLSWYIIQLWEVAALIPLKTLKKNSLTLNCELQLCTSKGDWTLGAFYSILVSPKIPQLLFKEQIFKNK